MTNSRFKFIFFAVVGLLIAYSGNSGATRNPTYKAKLDSLFTILDSSDKAMCSFAIAKNGVVEYTNAIGQMNVVGGKKIRPNAETKYRIGSISKMFTSTMIFQLIDEGKLSLSSHLSEWFADIPHANEITIDQMLSHHSGIHSFTDDSDYSDWSKHPVTEKEIVSKIAHAKPEFLPGEKSAYSNSNFVLLSYIIERLTGDTYAHQLTKRIVSKLGLTNTYYGSKLDPKKNEALSYRSNGEEWEVLPETDMSVPVGAGAISSTPSDLAKFITGLFQGKLISDSSLHHMTTLTDNFGRGIFKYPFASRFSYGHTGGIDGFTSFLEYLPDDSVAIAITSNGMVYNQNTIVVDASKIYYSMPFQLPVIAKTVAMHLDNAILASYTGTYTNKEIGMNIEMTVDHAQLVAQADGQPELRLVATANDTFVFEPANIKITFKHDQKNVTTGFTLLQQGATLEFMKE